MKRHADKDTGKAPFPFVGMPEKREVDPVRLMGIKQEIDRTIPTVDELTHLAATLAHGRTINKPMAEQLAKEVFELWNACFGERRQRIERQARLEIGRENAIAERNGIPKPDKYPVTFDDFLRLLVGGKYVANRVKIYRDYLKWSIEGSHLWTEMYPNPNHGEAVPYELAVKRVKPVLVDEVEFWMKEAKKRVYDHEELYLMEARSFLVWRTRQRSERARNAATRRWSTQTVTNKPLTQNPA